MKQRYWMVWQLCLLAGVCTLLAACGGGEDPVTSAEAGDPIPNVRSGMEAMYSGDLTGVDRFFTDAIVLSIKTKANQAASGQGGIDLSQVTFTVINKQSDDMWTIRMEGQYSVWLSGQQEWRDTAVIGALLVGVKIEDGIWKINGFDEVPPESTADTP